MWNKIITIETNYFLSDDSNELSRFFFCHESDGPLPAFFTWYVDIAGEELHSNVYLSKTHDIPFRLANKNVHRVPLIFFVIFDAPRLTVFCQSKDNV